MKSLKHETLIEQGYKEMPCGCYAKPTGEESALFSLCKPCMAEYRKSGFSAEFLDKKTFEVVKI